MHFLKQGVYLVKTASNEDFKSTINYTVIRFVGALREKKSNFNNYLMAHPNLKIQRNSIIFCCKDYTLKTIRNCYMAVR